MSSYIQYSWHKKGPTLPVIHLALISPIIEIFTCCGIKFRPRGKGYHNNRLYYNGTHYKNFAWGRKGEDYPRKKFTAILYLVHFFNSVVRQIIISLCMQLSSTNSNITIAISVFFFSYHDFPIVVLLLTLSSVILIIICISMY